MTGAMEGPARVAVVVVSKLTISRIRGDKVTVKQMSDSEYKEWEDEYVKWKNGSWRD